MRQYERIVVHPDFKKKLKIEAANKDVSLYQLTKNLADDYAQLSKRIKNEKNQFRI